MKKKILIIDDSALMRRVLSDIINSDERFIVQDLASNGLEGFDLVTRENHNYDAIVLDINMPRMNGIEFLEVLDKHHIKATVIVVSTIAKDGAKETIRALELGAFDFVTKPDSFYEAKSDQFKEKILSTLLTATRLDTVLSKSNVVNVSTMKIAKTKPINQLQETRKSIKGNKLVALACSTGGPKALQSVVPYLPKNLDAAVLIVQHMPEGFTKSLAVRLNELSNITVKEAQDGEIIQKGVVYIAQGGRQLRVKPDGGQYKLMVANEPARMGLCPCADIMYESLVDTKYDEVTCVVLTGMGSDGTQGIKELKEKKEVYTIAQDEATCTVYGMPKVVADANLADEILPLTMIAEAIVKNVGVC